MGRSGLLTAGLGSARGRGRGEHALEDGRVLGAVGAVTELAGDVHGADGADGLDPVVGRRRAQDVAAGGADAQRPDAVSVDVVTSSEERDRGLDVLDPVDWVLQAARLALALALVGGVEREGDEALLGQAKRVQAGGLLLHTAAGVTDDDRRARADGPVVRRVQVAGELQAGTGKGDVGPQGVLQSRRDGLAVGELGGLLPAATPPRWRRRVGGTRRVLPMHASTRHAAVRLGTLESWNSRTTLPAATSWAISCAPAVPLSIRTRSAFPTTAVHAEYRACAARSWPSSDT